MSERTDGKGNIIGAPECYEMFGNGPSDLKASKMWLIIKFHKLELTDQWLSLCNCQTVFPNK